MRTPSRVVSSVGMPGLSSFKNGRIYGVLAECPGSSRGSISSFLPSGGTRSCEAFASGLWQIPGTTLAVAFGWMRGQHLAEVTRSTLVVR